MPAGAKTLVSLTIAAAIGATASSATAAEPVYFFADGETPTALAGFQDSEKDVFTTKAGTVSCNEATYAGELGEEEAESVELAPSYSECTAFGFATATFAMNGCVYRFNGVTIEGEGQPEGAADIVCPEGKEIVVTVSFLGTVKCTIDVPSQSDIGTVTYANVEGSATEITTGVSIEEELTYTDTAGTGFGACSSASGSNGSYTGAALVGGEGAEEAPAGVALMAADPTFIVNPAVYTFKNKNTWEKITIENKSKTEEPKLDHIIRTPADGTHGFRDNCLNVTLKKEGNKGDTCTEEVLCFGAKDSFLNVGSSKSYAFFQATLKAC